MATAYRLSPMQQGMVYHSLDGRQPGVDIEQTYTDLQEELVLPAFQEAWDRIIARHTMLRTVFRLQADGEARQVVREPRPMELRVLDWCTLDGKVRSAVFERLLKADRTRGFDLENGPLLRAIVIRLGAGVHRFVLSFHHLLMDGRALVVVLRELFEIYESMLQDRPCELPPPPPYSAYIDWLESFDWTSEQDFWREYLKGFSTPTPLPMSRPAEGPGREGAGEVSLTFSSEQSQRFASVARRHTATLNTVIQAAWGLLLSRYSGERDIVFGTVRHGRNIPVEGADEMVGLLINTIPVRVTADPELTVGAWLEQLSADARETRGHEHTPLERIQGWSGVPAGRPLFETLVNFQKPAWDAALRALGGKWSNRHFAVRSQANFPIAVDAYGGPPLMVRIFYDRRLFLDDTMSRMLGHLRTLIEAMMENPDRAIGELPLLTRGESIHLLAIGAGERVDQTGSPCVHRQFEAQAARQPQRPAIVETGRTVSYGELDRLANRLANRLRRIGVRNDDLIGVYMKASVEMVAAWLAALKAGAAFVPIDPGQPEDRVVRLLKEDGLRVLLSDERHVGAVPAGVGPSARFGSTADWESLAGESDAAPQVPVGPQNLAYAIYTSGSTGQPKGVLVEHRSLSNLVAWHRDTYRVTPQDKASQLANPAFDAAVWEIWPYLACGASVYLMDEDTIPAPGHLVRWIADRGITIAFAPTPIAESLLTEPWPDDLTLRALLTGGDRLTRRPPPGFPCLVVNHYGPTECGVVATASPVDIGDADGTPPIGRPISNTVALVLDAQRHLVPIDVPGELYLSGAGVARSYLNRPDLSAERFVSDPLRVGDGSRFYRTGDRVRWRSDGDLEYLGRTDDQIKIRGFRIEPGEIEVALARHPAVRRAAVVVLTGAGGARLVAALEAATKAKPEPAELRTFLSGLLPDYMVPAGYSWLDALPLTPHGKLDRAAVSSLVVEPERRDNPAAPCSPLEQRLVRIWSAVLGLPSVGVNDDFFELGGHSLLAAQIIARLQTEDGGRLPLRAIFEHPTIAELAVEMERRGSCDPLPPLRRRRAAPAAVQGMQVTGRH